MNKNKAVNLHDVGKLIYEDIDYPVCKDDEVILKIKNCGICGSDIGRVYKTGTYHFPTIIGHEFSGEVIYSNDAALMGKRVAVFPLLPCFECEMCKSGRYAQCSNYDYYGSRRNGAFSEYIAVKKFNLTELPDNISFEEGAMCEPVSVALNAVKKLGDCRGKNILISGAGPIGLICAKWAKAFGANKIVFTDIDAERISFAKKLGFSEYNGENDIDVCIEGTGASSAVQVLIKAVRQSGKIVFLGNPSGDVTIDSKTYQLILRKEIKIEGTWNSMFSDIENNWAESLAAVSNGIISVKELITHRVKLENAIETLEMMRDKKEFYCKVMIENEK